MARFLARIFGVRDFGDDWGGGDCGKSFFFFGGDCCFLVGGLVGDLGGDLVGDILRATFVFKMVSEDVDGEEPARSRLRLKI